MLNIYIKQLFIFISLQLYALAINENFDVFESCRCVSVLLVVPLPLGALGRLCNFIVALPGPSKLIILLCKVWILSFMP